MKEMYSMEANGMTIQNMSGDYFFPDEHIREGLEKVILFPEADPSHRIPNGSAWTYKENVYRPEILGDDVGCGITGFMLQNYDSIDELADETLKVLEKEDISIGRGNHFIDICEGYDSTHKTLFIHSDMNKEGVTPKTLQKAQQMQKDAVEKRVDVIDTLTSKLGLKTEYLDDWTHNTVESEDGMVYRKGTISVVDNEGILALNPFDGMLLYGADFSDYDGMMQHSTGVDREDRVDMTPYLHGQVGKKRVFRTKGERPENLYKEYRSPSSFAEAFSMEYWPVKKLKSELVIKTD